MMIDCYLHWYSAYSCDVGILHAHFLCFRADLSNFKRNGHAIVLLEQTSLLFGYREVLLVRYNKYKPNAGQIVLLGLLAKV